jgi:hypothetical protein
MMMALEDYRGLLKMRTLNSLVRQKMRCLNDSLIQMSQKLLHLPIWVGKWLDGDCFMYSDAHDEKLRW